MGSVDYASLWIPFIYATEFDAVTDLEGGDARGEIDVMGNEQCLARCQAHNEALMPNSFGIVRKDFRDAATILNRNVALMIGEGGSEYFVASGNGFDSGRGRLRVPTVLVDSDIGDRNQN